MQRSVVPYVTVPAMMEGVMREYMDETNLQRFTVPLPRLKHPLSPLSPLTALTGHVQFPHYRRRRSRRS